MRALLHARSHRVRARTVKTRVPVARRHLLAGLCLAHLAGDIGTSAGATNATVVGWNNPGMHCMDADYFVFSILPPYNTVNAQVILTINGAQARLLTDTNGTVVTYHAVADADGSFNSTSEGKSNFRDYVLPLFGTSLPEDTGLPVPGPESYSMPGTTNVPQGMGWEAGFDWLVAHGIPITPYDDEGRPSQYPLLRLTATNASWLNVAETDVVLPVSDEMDCRLCHQSGAGDAARPAGGWVNAPHPGRDYRLNILRLHDEMQAADPGYSAALSSNAFHAAGLHATVVSDGTPILCAACHLSEALPDTGLPGIPPLTQVIHGGHATVLDPRNGLTLDAQANRVACYTCHPGSFTRCLRGAMGKAVAADGAPDMQCQSCHGTMSTVGNPARTGWLDEPNCQACHTGDAVENSGQIRYSSVFADGEMRVPTNTRFATDPDTPDTGHSLYRFSLGHGGLQCSACHGATHAEYPSAFSNDNVQCESLQGHPGMLVECVVCDGPSRPVVLDDGPHGMHSGGEAWVEEHHDMFEHDATQRCTPCHGTDLRGTVLSRSQACRTLPVSENGGMTRTFWRGFEFGCYDCHDGPSESDPSSNQPPVTTNVFASTPAGNTVTIPLNAYDPDGGSPTVRIVSQPQHGSVALTGLPATYYPETGFAGDDRFTFAASDSDTESNLSTGHVAVAWVDSVDDGIPDWWRRLHFGGNGTTTNASSCATCDPDMDRFSNSDEFGAGTDPNDVLSLLRIFALDAEPDRVSLGITSLLGMRYDVQRRDQMTSGTWADLFTGVWGKTDAVVVSDPDAPSRTSRFYRGRVSP